MKLKEYNVFGDDNEYCDMTFINDKGDVVKVSVYYKTNRTKIECDDVDIADVQEVLEMVASGKLEIEI